MSIYVGTTEIKDICIGAGVDDYSAMQGPCPYGFHIPTMSERTAVVNAGVSLGAWTASGGSNLRIKLHIPFAGFRAANSGAVNHQTYGRYWSCSVDSAKGKYLFLGASQISTTTSDIRCVGFSIRAFKDTPVKPDSSWTTIQSGTGGAGIYRSSTLGLISISSDGITRYTLADKNLGATSVYSDGNTLDQTNCGNYYQWGNCYGTPRTGTVTTSSTQVNTSEYGPGNFYYSSTFITGSGDRSSPKNDNLWGATTGVSGKKGNVIAVYVGTTKVRPEEVFTPSSSTVAYYDFKFDTLDKSGNGNDLFVNGYCGIGPLHTGPGVNLNGNGYLRTTKSLSLPNYTIIYRLYFSGAATSYVFAMPTFPDSYIYKYSSLYSLQMGYKASSSGTSGMGGAYISGNSWFMVAMTKSGANYNGYYFGSATPTVYTKSGYNSTASGVLTIGANSSGNNKINGSIGTFIVENTARSQTNIQKLYNKTKSLYGK